MIYNIVNIKDEEIIIVEDKFLDSKKYVTELKLRIKNNIFFNVIGLYGVWGSGKSSIIKTLINDCGKEYNFVEYDAWKHNDECIKRSFLLELMNKTNYPKKEMEEIRKRLYEESNVEEEVKEKYNFIKEIIFIALFGVYPGFPTKAVISDYKKACIT